MGKIKVLPQELVNRIAAGEVVEKPASIVKELLDNSFDAGANQITVDIEEGGIAKIHIVDNGVGMDSDDAQLAFQAHATSKISTDDDLLNIKSFGFRGEALSSIASVSKVTLKTRTSQNNMATEIKIEGGQILSVTETGGAVGTSILIEDLFYNVPARKEFLRAAPSEYKDILEVVNAHAMAKPDVGITLINNGKTVFNFPKNHQLEDRVREILGTDNYEKLIPLFYEHPHLEVYGFVGKPELASERKKHQYIFVNKRNIENKSIAFAAKDAYSSLIPKNTYPVFIIFIDVAPNIVDVNVHPRKEEVKFTNDHLIFDSVKNAVKKSLDRANLTPGSLPGSEGSFPQAPPQNAMQPNPFGSMPRSPSMNVPTSPFTRPNAFQSPFAKPATAQQSDSLWDKLPWEEDENSATNTSVMPKNQIKILSVHHLYFIAESESGIDIYDQHAVHERILYEKLTKKHNEDNIETAAQPLFTPIIINLSINESEFIKPILPKLSEAGFEMEEFGPNTYKVTQVPVVMQKVDIKTLVHELIEDLQHADNKEIDEQSNKILTYLSCRLAYKAGDTIPLEEIAELISQLDTMDNKYTCPHGRPVKVEISLKELSKMFKRT
jgi:DNA mismatch repair protein MutL